MSEAGRAVLVQLLGGRCVQCGRSGDLVIHHKNWNHGDDSIQNLELLCFNCHANVHMLTLSLAKQEVVTEDLGLVEHLSRPARRALTEAVCLALVERDRELYHMGVAGNRRGRPPINGCELLASRLRISPNTVGRWLGGEMQCSNANALDLIELASDLIPDRLQEILYEDSARYHAEIGRTFIGHGGGGLFPQ